MRDSNLIKYNLNIIKTHEEILTIIEEIKQFEKRYTPFEIEDQKVEEELIEQKSKGLEPFIKPSFSVSPTVFKLRFTEDGRLENIDLKKPRLKYDRQSSSKKFKAKDNIENKNSGKINRISKITNLISGISKIKRIIPSQGNKKE